MDQILGLVLACLLQASQIISLFCLVDATLYVFRMRRGYLILRNGMWKQYTQFIDEDRYRHTCTRGLTNSVFIIGGLDTDTEPTSHFLLEPKSLQQLAVHMIYQYKNLLPWKFLPSRIMDQLMDVTKQYVC